jgi:membrane-associated phospholipid phosphatase
MHPILQAGIDFILAIQRPDQPVLQQFFEIVTSFGGRRYLYLVPLLVWCVDLRLGVRVCVSMAATLFLNTTLKEWIGQPRPFELDERIVSAGEAGYGLPSGHAQLVVVYWGLWADWLGRRDFWAFALVVMCLMGLSRVYLGVHFPTDVVAGWALGGLTLWVVIRGRRIWADRFSAEPTARIAAFTGIAMALGFAFDWFTVRDHTFLNVASLGFAGGAVLGALWSFRRGRFDAGGPIWKRALRYVLGMVCTLAMLIGMRRLGLPTGDLAARVGVTLDLFVFAFWITGAAPRLFELLRLSGPGPAAPAGGISDG